MRRSRIRVRDRDAGVLFPISLRSCRSAPMTFERRNSTGRRPERRGASSAVAHPEPERAAVHEAETEFIPSRVDAPDAGMTKWTAEHSRKDVERQQVLRGAADE